MIFNNLELSYLSPEIELILLHIVGYVLAKNFDLSTDENDLKVVFCVLNIPRLYSLRFKSLS